MKIYAKAEKVPKHISYITKSKLYEVFYAHDDGFISFYDDTGLVKHSYWGNSAHLDGGSWTRVEAGTLEELNLKEGDVIQCVEEVPCKWVATEGLTYTVEEYDVICIGKEDWHEVKHLFTVVSRAEETKENTQVKEQLFAGKFKVGDKIRWKRKEEEWVTENTRQQRVYTIVSPTRAEHEDGGHINTTSSSEVDYKLVGEEQVNKPKMWKDMSPEEKGALLLACHEGKDIEFLSSNKDWHTCRTAPSWYDNFQYRVKPSPVIKEKEYALIYDNKDEELWGAFTDEKPHFKLKYRLVDGELDEASMKVEKC